MKPSLILRTIFSTNTYSYVYYGVFNSGTLILAIAVPVGTALLVAFATFIVLQIKHQKEEMAWQIPRAAIVFDDPPIVLGLTLDP